MSKDIYEYDSIRKIIMKNLKIDYYQLTEKGSVRVNPTEKIHQLVRDININPEVIDALENHFREKFNAEKKEI